MFVHACDHRGHLDGPIEPYHAVASKPKPDSAMVGTVRVALGALQAVCAIAIALPPLMMRRHNRRHVFKH
jgi:hypothetical protein